MDVLAVAQSPGELSDDARRFVARSIVMACAHFWFQLDDRDCYQESALGLAVRLVRSLGSRATAADRRLLMAAREVGFGWIGPDPQRTDQESKLWLEEATALASCDASPPSRWLLARASIFRGGSMIERGQVSDGLKLMRDGVSIASHLASLGGEWRHCYVIALSELARKLHHLSEIGSRIYRLEAIGLYKLAIDLEDDCPASSRVEHLSMQWSNHASIASASIWPFSVKWRKMASQLWHELEIEKAERMAEAERTGRAEVNPVL
jgi:hypothetical protein